MPPYRPIEDRFWEKVSIDPYGGCWEWCGSRTDLGYGKIRISREKRNELAHRISWIFHFGSIPKELWVLHRCDDPSCVNPEHLFLGDHTANMADMRAKGRSTRGEQMHNAKLTDEAVREARVLASTGVFQKDIAKGLGVGRRTIGKAIRGKTWQHVV